VPSLFIVANFEGLASDSNKIDAGALPYLAAAVTVCAPRESGNFNMHCDAEVIHS
jgi:hypothetical protein